MSSEPLLEPSEREMPVPGDVQDIADDQLKVVDGKHVIDTRGEDEIPDYDPTAPSYAVGSKRQRMSDLFTILCAGCALISDGYANSLMTLINVILRLEYAKEYTSNVSTRGSNALLVGEIIGQISIGYVLLAAVLFNIY
jgi:hypothetical protein